MTDNERYDDCMQCNERYWGEQAIANYLREQPNGDMLCLRCQPLKARKKRSDCEICGDDITHGRGCTNGRCMPCHWACCTPGGNTGPGHGRGTQAAIDRRLADVAKREGAI